VKHDSGTSLVESLGGLNAPSSAYRPIFFALDRDEDRERLRELLASQATHLTRQDSLREQVAELLKVRDPAAVVSADDARAHVERHGGEAYGSWVYYPWRSHLVRTLPKAEFRELRTARNRYKITSDEQERLLGATVGIVGLSAGHSIAVCLALEGVGGSLRLADFDAVELSNTNRVPCGLPGLGTNKAVLAARRAVEIDPYLQVEVYADGLSEDTLDGFLTGNGRLDLLVEECDDLWLKVRLREEARRLRVPVVMETNDRGLLDIERFDREPQRPIFHGLLGDTSSADLRGLELEAKTPFVLRVVGSNLSPRAAASLVEINRSITGWPQLGSGTTLGGAVVTDVSRRILLGQLERSGRYYVDLEAIVDDAPALSRAREPASHPTPPTATPAVSTASAPRAPMPSVAGQPAPAQIRRLVELATTAPSGGNAQPWRFTWTGEKLDLWVDRSRAGSFLDVGGASSHLALGSAAEALVHAATTCGYSVELVPFPDAREEDLVCRATFARSTALAPSELSSLLEVRCTNRRLGSRVRLAPAHRQALVDAALSSGAELELVTDPEPLDELGALLGDVDRLRFLSERLHADLMAELRWSAEDARATGDGIDIATLELDAAGMAALRLLRDPAAVALLRTLDQGQRLTTSARRAVDASSAVGLLTTEGTGPAAYFQGGRAVERVWLTATKLGLSLQPMAVAPYLFAKLERGGIAAFTARERSALERLRQRFSSVFTTGTARAEVLVFRIAHAEPPGVRSLRRPVETVLLWD